MNRQELTDELVGLLHLAQFGCCNHGCVVRKNQGQMTNSSCFCENRILKGLKHIIDKIEKEHIKEKKKI